MKIHNYIIIIFLISLFVSAHSQSRILDLNNNVSVMDWANRISNEVPTGLKITKIIPVSSAKIRYSIAKATGVRITVYDILAREVKTVVNEYQQPGAYETDFGGPIGTYYYKIQTGDYTQVKKIVINK